MPLSTPLGGRRLAAAATALAALGLSVGAGLSLAPAATATPPGGKDVTATLFEWKFDSVAKACTDTLGPKGYGSVEVSPAQEHIQGAQWWTSYQPVSYRIAGRLGDRASFQRMVGTCHAAGVKVIADAVVNHMSAGSGTGTGGTAYGKYTYPGSYQDQDFHSCRTPISNYGDRSNVQNCELVGLADLDTGSGHVQQTIADYLNDLLSLGVDGFRIDAAKHIAASDLAAIKSKLSNPNAYWVQEVIYGAGEAVQPGEYTGNGDVDEFRSATWLKSAFNGGRISDLQSWGSGLLGSAQARTFVDNWDTERNGSTLTYTYGSAYTLANVFLLADPYGSPNVYSGYAFGGNDDGPPNGGTVNACYQDGWNCTHAWRQVANMVGFRNAVSGTGMTDWWSNGNNAIAFGRGTKGYVAINRESGAITRTFQTSLPAGAYCDVQHGDPVNGGGCTGPTYTVGADGRFTATVGAGDAVALYVGAGGNGATPTPSASASPSVPPTGGNSATVFYSTDRNWSAYDLHYAPNGGSWTTVPGVAMDAACTGWVKKTVSLGGATGLAATFNNGNGTWDNNGGNNYALGTGSITVKDGAVGSGDPCAAATASPSTSASASPPTGSGASFAVNATTAVGQNVYLVGDAAGLGGWDTAKALPLSAAAYPVWKLDVALGAGTAIQYKYIRKDAAGNVTWESGANRTATVPATGRITLNDTWRG
ncbi:alpha-amylase [Kitasatospora sp. SolWspMP-SS2h]|uniref:carbohydrate binding domain-containing protein n=1 Tax=Kitasatospora sp. SolWspMP-SS2h TaxID=1305729 RepID=UPI000DBFA511|nr:carbohydrate binding domain-containing protein [Kitasatospora sp. SolWspMP-SS2h]RAJ43511.1 alpha-amylase [Kitasatospora sp. SolWspMP-SS2h]